MKAKDLKKFDKRIGGYLFCYKAVEDEKLTKFLELQQLKKVDTLTVFSPKNNPSKIKEILDQRSTWADEISDIKYPKYELLGVRELYEGEPLINTWKTCFWRIEFRPDEKAYACFTTYNRLKYINIKYGVKALLFSKKDSGKKVYLIKDPKDYNHLISLGKVIAIDPRVQKQCLRLKESLGHTTEFIYDQKIIPIYKTKEKHNRKRKIVIGKPNYLPEYDPERQRLVCITDDVSVKRLPKYKADKIIARFPKIHFCEKHVYNQYMNEIHSFLPRVHKDPLGNIVNPRESLRKLTVQGDKNNPKERGNRHDRRANDFNKKLLTHNRFKQQISGKWVDEEPNKDGIVTHQRFVPTKGKVIIATKAKPSYTPKQSPSEHATARKQRLLAKYKEVFADIERRNSKFSSIETWSTQFMIILNMVKMGKPEHEIALYISKIFTGWNDKKIKRFITYLKLTRHGLNYVPNKTSTNKPKFYEKVEVPIKQMQIAKLPYNTPLAIKYDGVNDKGEEGILLARGVTLRQKKMVKTEEIDGKQETVIVCALNDVKQWVIDTNYSDDNKCKWQPLVTVIPATRVEIRKIEYHLPKRKQKTKKWKHPIRERMPF